MLRSAIHLILHLALPGIVAVVFFRDRWRRAWLVMLLTMIVDVDHLLADPIFDPRRCSLGFHPLHSYTAVPLYVGLTVFARTRLVGVGLMIHMALDAVDCLMNG